MLIWPNPPVGESNPPNGATQVEAQFVSRMAKDNLFISFSGNFSFFVSPILDYFQWDEKQDPIALDFLFEKVNDCSGQ